MATLSATVCLEQEALLTVKERDVLSAIQVGRREFVGKPELDIESLATSVVRKSCQNMKVKQEEIFSPEETNMHKM